MGGPFFSGLLSLGGVVREGYFDRPLLVLALEENKAPILAKQYQTHMDSIMKLGTVIPNLQETQKI